MSLEQRGLSLPALDRSIPISVAAWRQASIAQREKDSLGYATDK